MRFSLKKPKKTKNFGKQQRWGQEWTTQKDYFSGSLPFSLILELSHEVLKARKENALEHVPWNVFFRWRNLGMIKRVYWLFIAAFVILEWSKVPIKDPLRHHFYSKITRLGLPWPWIWVAGLVLFFLLVASHFPAKMNWTILKVIERKLVLFSLTS